MRYSPRSKVGILLSAVTILTVVSAFMVTIASQGAATHAASPPPTIATYNASAVKGSQLLASKTFPDGSTQLYQKHTGPMVIGDRSPGSKNAPTTATGKHAPATASTAVLNVAEGKLLHNFNGLSDVDQAIANGGLLAEGTNPDQGLCVGNDPTLSGNPTVTLEMVNLAFAEYSASGALLRPVVSLVGLFGDPFAHADPRCFYDARNHTFFFTILSQDSTGANTVDDVLVLNARGFALYQFPTSIGGTCFGDQPHVGYDNTNLYLATDEFCGANFSTYSGAFLIAASKSQLISEAASVNAVSFGPVSLGGVPILTLQPAISAGVGTEYLLNSFPFDQFGNNNSIAHTLGLWQVHGGQNVTTGNFGAVTLTGKMITSETYAFPLPAASTGSGVTSSVTVGGMTIPVLSEQFLNPNDDRMQQVQVVNDKGELEMWASLSTAINITGDPSARDGVAWFNIDVQAQRVSQQGYVASAGNYLLYPAILHTNEGTTTLVFTITSTTLNPSAAYAVLKSDATRFSSINMSALGAGAHKSFAFPVTGRTRWGDYSAAALDPSGNNIWQATEYIPPAANQGPLDNWGTRVSEVAGDHSSRG